MWNRMIGFLKRVLIPWFAIACMLVVVVLVAVAPQKASAQTTADMVVQYPGAHSYFSTTIDDPGSGPYDGTFFGWCADRYVFISPGVHYTVDLWDDYSDLPPHAQGIAWDKINYVLNHKQGSWNDVQQVMWYFSDGVSPSSSAAQAMVADANANGAGFVPLPGQMKAIICDAGTTVQLTFIEYKLPCCMNVEKTGPQAAQIGDNITYNFTITNCGVCNLTVHSVNDDLLSDLTSNFTAANGGSNIMSGMSSLTFSFHRAIACNDTDPLVNTVTVNATSGNNTGSFNSSHSIILHFQEAGTVFQDDNDNGVYDPGEPTFENVVVELYDESGTLVATSRTDVFGHYFFDGLEARTYTIVVPESTPSEPDAFNETLFGLFQPTTATQIGVQAPPCSFANNFGFFRPVVPLVPAVSGWGTMGMIIALAGCIVWALGRTRVISKQTTSK